MIDLFPHVYATLKASSYFVTTLGGFLDEGGNFKVYKRNEAPNADTPYITVEIQPGGEDQNSAWVRPFVLFNVWGKETEWDDLYAIALEIKNIFQAANAFAAVAGGTPVQYQTVGPAEFDEGEDPVVDRVVVSVSLRFAFDAA